MNFFAQSLLAGVITTLLLTVAFIAIRDTINPAPPRSEPMRPARLNPIDQHLGARIRMRRQQLGISQGTLGDALGVTFQQVQKYEKGLNRVGGSRLAQIAAFLQVEVGFFFQNSPGAEGGPDSVMDEFMASKDGLIIADAFVQIADPDVRHAIAAAIALIGRAMTPKPVTLMAAE
jgi:transcriptional regulator with XRE-family HTH domain